MLEQDIIRPSTSPYCSPITVVNKPDGSIRLCIDFRKLNSITEFDNESIPQLEEIMTRVHKAKYFSKLDMTKGYFQIPLEENSKKYTAFQTSMGLMEFNYLPFGLSTAAPSFNRAMSRTLQGLPFVASYFDDILIFSDSWKEHVQHINQTLETLGKANFTVKPSKCMLGSKEINFLGHVVSHGLIKPDPQKTEKILNLQRPKTKKDVRKICGLANYYRRFIPFFANIMAPLTNLTRASFPNTVNWTAECERAFNGLKQAMSSNPVLILPDLNKQFVVRSDASSKAIGAVLLQEKDGILRPISYVSRKLLDREQNYPICEKECLGVVFALHKFAGYLMMRKFLLQVDSKVLTVMKINKSLNPRLLRWSLALQGFAYDIEHIPGPQNRISDILSRF
ncbi:polyprotein [Plakobranchus ocellatus]|uniref:Polyprotein n=1 Tax=Plakobranchus ocellatus TaxID=259542 RepID=A0AAV4CXU3_9GAST|nr:polyprotein [Plakobranchus ocellatus]